jgi:hypothetical protein
VPAPGGETALPRPASPAARRLAQVLYDLERQLAQPADPGAAGALRLVGAMDLHLDVVRAALELRPASRAELRGGLVGQQPQRQLEEVVRLRAVHLAERLSAAGTG